MAFQPNHPLRVAISARFSKDKNTLKVSLKEIETENEFENEFSRGYLQKCGFHARRSITDMAREFKENGVVRGFGRELNGMMKEQPGMAIEWHGQFEETRDDRVCVSVDQFEFVLKLVPLADSVILKRRLSALERRVMGNENRLDDEEWTIDSMDRMDQRDIEIENRFKLLENRFTEFKNEMVGKVNSLENECKIKK